jgi:hypothetical protein
LQTSICFVWEGDREISVHQWCETAKRNSTETYEGRKHD